MSTAESTHWVGTVALAQGLESLTAKVLPVAREKVHRLLRGGHEASPMYTRGRKWVVERDPWAPDWSEGFHAGMCYVLGELTEDADLVAWGDTITNRTRKRVHDESTHDLGFIFQPGWGWRYRVRGEAVAAEVLAQAGVTLAGRYIPQGRYLSTWVDPSNTFVDIMMNVGLIRLAGGLLDRADLLEIADNHVATTTRYLLRGDGSVAHEAWFDIESGAFKGTASQQGWKGDSSWSRGHAWALAGFVEYQELTGRQDLLQIASRLAERYLARTPDGVPPNDWDEPGPLLPKETSAAAIAAYGLVRLAGREPDPFRREVCLSNAAAIMTRLIEQGYVDLDPRNDGILHGVIYHQARGLGVGESVMFGDYYFLAALNALQKEMGSSVAQQPSRTLQEGGGNGRPQVA